MKCKHEKIVEIIFDLDKAKSKELVAYCFKCPKCWNKKQWNEYLKETE